MARSWSCGEVTELWRGHRAVARSEAMARSRSYGEVMELWRLTRSRAVPTSGTVWGDL